MFVLAYFIYFYPFLPILSHYYVHCITFRPILYFMFRCLIAKLLLCGCQSFIKESYYYYPQTLFRPPALAPALISLCTDLTDTD